MNLSWKERFIYKICKKIKFDTFLCRMPPCRNLKFELVYNCIESPSIKKWRRMKIKKHIAIKGNQIMQLSSSESTKVSLEAIRMGDAGLSERRRNILKRVPNSNDWSTFEKESISIKDIAYLSAATEHEFALLRGKTKDIVFHGVRRHCDFTDELLELLKTKKLRLIAHTHPDYGMIKPSQDDRLFLEYIGQKESVIISYITGMEQIFYANLFDEF